MKKVCVRRDTMVGSGVRVSEGLGNCSFPRGLSDGRTRVVVRGIGGTLSNSGCNFVLRGVGRLDGVRVDSLARERLMSSKFLSGRGSTLLVGSSGAVYVLVGKLSRVGVRMIKSGSVGNLCRVTGRVSSVLRSRLRCTFSGSLKCLAAYPIGIKAKLGIAGAMRVPSVGGLGRMSSCCGVTRGVKIGFGKMCKGAGSVLKDVCAVSGDVVLKESRAGVVRDIRDVSGSLDGERCRSESMLGGMGGVSLRSRVFESLTVLSDTQMVAGSRLVGYLSGMGLNVRVNCVRSMDLSGVAGLVAKERPCLGIVDTCSRRSGVRETSCVEERFDLTGEGGGWCCF